MPELPEVENVRLSLAKILTPETEIIEATLRRKDIRFKVPPALVAKIKNKSIIQIRRRAKYLLFDFANGTMLNHLGMTGSWRLLQASEEFGIHDHFFLKLSTQQTLVFRDPRRFGMLDFFETKKEAQHPRLKDLGPEPLDEGKFSHEYLFQKTRKRQTPIKTFIMNQKNVVGVGNIYASEALFNSKISPFKKASKLTSEETGRLRIAIFEILKKAIELGGSSIRDFVSGDGAYGSFQNQFSVYARQKQNCKICKTVIKMKVQTGRSTFWCPKCQK